MKLEPKQNNLKIVQDYKNLGLNNIQSTFSNLIIIYKKKKINIDN